MGIKDAYENFATLCTICMQQSKNSPWAIIEFAYTAQLQYLDADNLICNILKPRNNISTGQNQFCINALSGGALASFGALLARFRFTVYFWFLAKKLYKGLGIVVCKVASQAIGLSVAAKLHTTQR